MKALIQRVSKASVTIENTETKRISRGLAVFLGVGTGDTGEDAAKLADKIVNMRIFPDENGRFDLSAADVNGEILIVSQFTLYADTSRGKRPDFTGAAKPADARPLYEKFVELVRSSGLKVVTGEFGADMLVDISNDGPVTIMTGSGRSS